jgi:hypothetical protein
MDPIAFGPTLLDPAGQHGLTPLGHASSRAQLY